jgi:hypothetical protein
MVDDAIRAAQADTLPPTNLPDAPDIRQEQLQVSSSASMSEQNIQPALQYQVGESSSMPSLHTHTERNAMEDQEEELQDSESVEQGLEVIGEADHDPLLDWNTPI